MHGTRQDALQRRRLVREQRGWQPIAGVQRVPRVAPER